MKKYFVLLLLSFVLVSCGKQETQSIITTELPRNTEQEEAYINKDTGLIENKIEGNTCSFQNTKFPKDFLILAGGAYAGLPSGYQIDQSGHEATIMDVTVNTIDKPVVLMLGNHEPTIWKIKTNKNTKIIGIFISGYYKQIIHGVSKEIPIINSTYENNGNCGIFFLDGDDGMKDLELISQKVFDRGIDKKYFANEGFLQIGQAIESNELLISDSNSTIESYFIPLTPKAGHRGIQDALNNGQLRHATFKDAREYHEAYERHRELEFGVIPRPFPETGNKDSDYLGENAFVILKPFTLPSGLYGKNAITFFVPKGVPYPDGKPGHANINDFNTLRQ